VSAIKVHVRGGTWNIAIPQCKGLVGAELEGALGVFPEAVKRGSLRWERGGELQVLVFENKKSLRVGRVWCGIKENIAGGFARQSEAKWGGVVEGENKV